MRSSLTVFSSLILLLSVSKTSLGEAPKAPPIKVSLKKIELTEQQEKKIPKYYSHFYKHLELLGEKKRKLAFEELKKAHKLGYSIIKPNVDAEKWPSFSFTLDGRGGISVYYNRVEEFVPINQKKKVKGFRSQSVQIVLVAKEGKVIDTQTAYQELDLSLASLENLFSANARYQKSKKDQDDNLEKHKKAVEKAAGVLYNMELLPQLVKKYGVKKETASSIQTPHSNHIEYFIRSDKTDRDTTFGTVQIMVRWDKEGKHIEGMVFVIRGVELRKKKQLF